MEQYTTEITWGDDVNGEPDFEFKWIKVHIYNAGNSILAAIFDILQEVLNMVPAVSAVGQESRTDIPHVLGQSLK